MTLSALSAQQTCETHLCRLISAGRCSQLKWPDYADYRDRLRQFYEPSRYAFAWTHEGIPTAAARAEIALFEAAAAQGLDAIDYDGDRWQDRLAHPDPVYFDLTLTVSLMRYLSDLHYGKSNPAFFHVDGKREDLDLATFIRARLLNEENPQKSITELEPPFDGYKRTKLALRDYIERAQQPDVVVPEIEHTIEIGQAFPQITALVQRLRQLGDLPLDTTWKEKRYNGSVVEAVKHFQLRHGLEADGRIGKTTLTELNTPLSQRVLQLRLSLERWRWVPHSFERPPVVVNVPEFTLRALNDTLQTELEIKVVVGSAFEHQTPTFAAQMKTITFRPYWNVPRSILLNEMADDLESDRSYLLKHRYEVVDGADHPVNAGKPLSNKTLQGLLAGRYRVRQLPGPTCALGLLRFGIPNPYNVYLHATPALPLFDKRRRDFSHGCVRVEQPVALAEWALRGTGSWTKQSILTAMHGKKTFEVKLNKPIPVLIVYATAVAPKEGGTRFFPDIYGQDRILEHRLTSGYPSRQQQPDAN